MCRVTDGRSVCQGPGRRSRVSQRGAPDLRSRHTRRRTADGDGSHGSLTRVRCLLTQCFALEALTDQSYLSIDDIQLYTLILRSRAVRAVQLYACLCVSCVAAALYSLIDTY